MVNDINMGAALCTTCGTLVDSKGVDDGRCPVCNSCLEVRKKNSLQRTWALTIASLLLYLPANFLPMMDLQVLGESEKNTIIEGVIQFFKHEMYFIGAVVFTASFIVPLFKIGVLLYLLISIKRKSRLTNLQKTRLYSIIDHIGKWSMLDVFVVAIMAGLINTGYLLNVTGGTGVVFFAVVVILTMLASASFDTRLIWDED